MSARTASAAVRAFLLDSTSNARGAAMPEMSTAKFHSDHLAWKQDIEMWRQDAASWRKEQLRVLNDVKLALFTEQSLIQQHLDAVERHQHLIDAHERLLVLCETPPVRQHNEMEARIAVTHE